MKSPLTRRQFLKRTSFSCLAATAGISFSSLGAAGANERVRVAVIGCNNRGMDHIAGYLAVPQAEVGCVCDVDSRALAKGLAAVAKKQTRAAKGAKDLRRVLEDPEIDAVSIATPDHWHTPAAVLACSAGKHVYVEKPGSHNAHESELIVSAARKHKRVMQMGNQRRSWPWVIDAITALREGELGKLFFALTWYTNHRPSIGRGKVMSVPDWLDYALWQGVAPERPYRDNILPYNWHWFWNWGTGELGNNGVHALDLARWGLGVDTLHRVTCSGNRYHFQDDWETPDTCVAFFDFGDKGIQWEGQSCDPHGFEGAQFGVQFHGEKGSMALAGNNVKFYDLNNKTMREIKGAGDDVRHFANFVAAIREGEKLNSDIADGQKSTMLCHLGNIAWRTGHSLEVDPTTSKPQKDSKAAALWKREYRQGWEPKI